MNRLVHIPRHLGSKKNNSISKIEVQNIVCAVVKRRLEVNVIQRRYRNEVFCVADEFIFKLYLLDSEIRAKSNAFALKHLSGCFEVIPKFIADGLFENYYWTLETKIPESQYKGLNDLEHAKLHFKLGEWIKKLHLLNNQENKFGYLSKVCATYNIAEYMRNSLEFSLEQAKNSVEVSLLNEISDSLNNIILRNSNCIISPVFLHGSFTLSNAAISLIDEKPEVTAVYDFEEAHFGDPMEEFSLVGLYGLKDKRFEELIKGYGVNNHDYIRSVFWIGIRAIEILAWAPKIGDIPYEKVAQNAAREIILFNN